MKYEVTIPFTVKTKQGDLTLNPGQAITLVAEKAIKLIADGKIRPIEPDKQITKRYEPTEADWALDRYHAQQDNHNQKGYKCIICSNIGETYRLINKTDRWWFGWVCRNCKPNRN